MGDLMKDLYRVTVVNLMTGETFEDTVDAGGLDEAVRIAEPGPIEELDHE